MSKALIVVDVQQDFCPGGALPAPKGNEVVPVINSLMDKFDYVVASKDWHPAQTVHFNTWPVHCVRASAGAAFHKDLNEKKINEVFLKGTGNSDDGYSAFEATNRDLLHWLKKNDIDTVYVCGIATEYCVKATAMDALQSGLQVFAVTDAVAAVEAQAGDEKHALTEMQNAGIQLVVSEEIL
ncbi:MAG TPA: isochorismatase family protein [Hanamia sp.]|nr:isochorismatase family protein [Hanamia sp.]